MTRVCFFLYFIEQKKPLTNPTHELHPRTPLTNPIYIYIYIYIGDQLPHVLAHPEGEDGEEAGCGGNTCILLLIWHVSSSSYKKLGVEVIQYNREYNNIT
jgi:hypothetical protein